MRDEREFDGIVRRKLRDRDLPFREEDWLQVEQVLAAQRRSRRRAAWLRNSALLLLLAAGAWWTFDHVAGTDAPVLATTPEATRTADPSPVPNTGTTPSASPGTPTDARPSALSGPEASPAPAPARTAPPAPTTIHRPATAPAPTPIAHARPHTRTSGDTSTERSASHGTTTYSKPGDASTAPAMTAPARNDDPAGTVPVPTPGATNDDRPATDVPAMAATANAASPAAESGSSTEVDAPSVAPLPASGPQVIPTPPAPALISDSVVAPTTPPRTDLVVEHALHTEVGLLAGINATHVAYGGNVDPDQRTADGTSSGGGVELMRLGKHFGFGVGAHFTSYQEQLNVADLDRTHSAEQKHYFLVPHDTTVLIVVDTVVVGGITQYVTQHQQFTINVLVTTMDTIRTVEHVRTARVLENRVSYVEVPLLLDAHTTTGRWTFGLRGGPMIGFASDRRVVLPMEGGDGYAELQREAFRSTVFGYQARAYVRYRLAPKWYVGLEPGMRGQWGNGLKDDAISRTATALSGMLSLTYRLP